MGHVVSALLCVGKGRPWEATVEGQGAVDQFSARKTRGRMVVTEVTGKGMRGRGGSAQGSLEDTRQTASWRGGCTLASHLPPVALIAGWGSSLPLGNGGSILGSREESG